MKKTTLKRIEIVVGADGQSSVETKGFAGAECLEASRFLETALGTSHGEKRTTDYYSPVVRTDAGVSHSHSEQKEGP